MILRLPHLPGVITADEVTCTAASIARLQLENGMIPWFPGGHCDPWNHVETAMALDVAGLTREAEHAYEWLASTQRPDGSWHNYYRTDGSVEDAKLDTNVCAYVAAGVWHHWLCSGDMAFVERSWPMVASALEFVLALRRTDGTVLWACEVDSRPWDYALLTGCASIQHALDCGAAIAELVEQPRREWLTAADLMRSVIVDQPDAFEPKTRWAMDWYYPVLTGAMGVDDSKARLSEWWSSFVMTGRGVRCVSDEPWVTAAETAECALAHAAIDDMDTARELLGWTGPHRCDDGSYLTGLVHPARQSFPDGERTAYTAAAVILAADAISQASPACQMFTRPVAGPRDR